MSEDSQAYLAGFRMGALLAGYRLETQVGAGGMAVVFRARDERLDRLVALKVLAPALESDEHFRVRFIAESRAAAAVDDPFIIPVYEAGESDGLLFIAMRFVAGGDLYQVLDREGPLTPERAAEFISPVASALDAAHRAGLVHRDVKPGNILVDAREDRPDHVYLSDFGVAKTVSSAGLTGSGFFVGTPNYAAPEQIQGRALDGRADQYALACVAFQLLTGTLPFRPDQDLPVLLAHVSNPPPSLIAERPDLPGAVDQVMASAMAKAPEQRYPSCLDFAGALREALGLPPFDPGGSADPRPAAPARDAVTLAPAAADPAQRTATVTARIRRRRLPVLALAGTALAAVAAIAFALASPAKSVPTGSRVTPPPTRPAGTESTPSYASTAIRLPSAWAGEVIMSLAFSRDNRTLAIANGRKVCLWDIATGTGCRTSAAGADAHAVAFSHDGTTVAVGSVVGHVVLLTARTVAKVAEFPDPALYEVVSLAFSPDGKTVAAGDSNGDTYLWDVHTKKAAVLPVPLGVAVQTVVFSPDGKTLAVGDLDGSVYLFDVSGRELIRTLSDPGSGGVNSTAFSPDGAMVAAGDFNGNTYLWDIAPKSVARVYTDPGGRGVNAIAFSPDGTFLVAGDDNGEMYIWDAASDRLVHTLAINGVVKSMAFTPDGKTLATGDENGDLTLWSI